MNSQLIRTSAYQRWISGIIISVIGLMTGILHIDHLFEDLHTMPVVSGVVFPLCLSMILLYAGYWLGMSDYSGKQAVSTVIWSIVGAIVLTLLGSIILAIDIFFHHHSMIVIDSSTPVIILPSSVTEGTAIGFTYGIYRLHHKVF